MHLSTGGYLGCFSVLAILNKRCYEHKDAYVFSNYSSTDICPGKGLLNLRATLFLAFLKEPPYFFHSGCTNLHSQQQCRKEFVFSTIPFQHFSFLDFLMIYILTGMGWWLVWFWSSKIKMKPHTKTENWKMCLLLIGYRHKKTSAILAKKSACSYIVTSAVYWQVNPPTYTY